MIFQAHISRRPISIVPAEGPAVLFDSQPGRFTGQELPTIDEISPDVLPLNYHVRRRPGRGVVRRAGPSQIAELVARDGAGNRRIAIEALQPLSRRGALAKRGTSR